MNLRKSIHSQLQKLPTSEEIKDQEEVRSELSFLEFSQFSHFSDKVLHFYMKTRLFFMVLFMIILSITLYIITLNTCSKSEMTCLHRLVRQVPESFIFLFLSAFLVDLIIYFIIKGVFPKKFLYLLLAEFYFIAVASKGSNIQRHGNFNLFLFVALLVWNYFLMRLFIVIYKIILRHPKITFVILFIFSMNFYILFVVIWFRNSCQDWKSGFKNTSASNENCRLPTPDICFNSLTNDWFDFSRILDRNQCSKVKSVLNIYEHEYDFIAYPKTQFFIKEEKCSDVFQKNILQRVKPVNEEEIIYEKHEVVLDRRDSDPVVNINVFRNETLVERSHKIMNSHRTSGPISRNIITIFIDSVSRQQFFRMLKKTNQWLESHYSSPSSSLESFQFFKYNSLGNSTVSNMWPLFYGTEHQPLPRNKPKKMSYSLTRSFKDQGYITAKSNNFCGSTYFETLKNDSNHFPYLDLESFDHENIALFCDPNYQKIEKNIIEDYFDGSSSLVRRCLYGKDTHDYVIEYGKKFWDTYEDQPKVLELGFMDGNGPSDELAKYLDEPIYMFLSEMEEKGKLDNTSIIIYSDHGHKANLLYHLFDFKDLDYEVRLPLIFMVLPRKLADEYGENVKSYEQNLISAYDIYNLFNTLAGNKIKSELGINIFEKSEIGRYCENFKLLNEFCLCK